MDPKTNEAGGAGEIVEGGAQDGTGDSISYEEIERLHAADQLHSEAIGNIPFGD